MSNRTKSWNRASIIMALMEEKTKNPDIQIGYFFFSFSDRDNQSSSKMLSALTQQLCGNCDKDGKISALRLQSMKPGIIYIVIDALDESEGSSVLRDLCLLADASMGKFNILLTSRKESYIEEGLSTLALKSIDIQNSVVDSDIQLFVRGFLQDNAKFQKWPLETRKMIETKLLEGAQGM